VRTSDDGSVLAASLSHLSHTLQPTCPGLLSVDDPDAHLDRGLVGFGDLIPPAYGSAPGGTLVPDH
jgi:hypothetical protein